MVHPSSNTEKNRENGQHFEHYRSTNNTDNEVWRMEVPRIQIQPLISRAVLQIKLWYIFKKKKGLDEYHIYF
jgi:hypothetical protein